MSTERRQVVIGYGNRLRGDDGVGPAAAETVQSWHIPGLHVVIVQQLLPELIEELKDAQRLLFIDAAADSADAFTCRKVMPNRARRTLGHHQTPGDLLALVRDLEGREVEAWLVTISALSFHHGDGLSESARENMEAALAFVRTWVGQEPGTTSA